MSNRGCNTIHKYRSRDLPSVPLPAKSVTLNRCKKPAMRNLNFDTIVEKPSHLNFRKDFRGRTFSCSYERPNDAFRGNL